MLFLLGLFTVQNHDRISYPFIYLKPEKGTPFGAEPPRIGHRRENPPGTILVPWPRRFSWTNSAEWPWGPKWFALLIREMSGASSRRLGAFDPERRIDNQSSILYYSISCTSHPGGGKCHVNKRSFFWENLQLIGLVLTPRKDHGFFLNKGAQSKTIKSVIAKTKQIQRDTCYEY